MRFVMKFGGTSLADAESILRTVAIVKQNIAQGHQVVIVTSALPGVTDALVKVGNSAAQGNLHTIDEFVSTQIKSHCDTTKKCINKPEILNVVISELSETMKELHEILRSVGRLRELTPRAQDFIQSFGERLSTPIVCAAANNSGLDAVWLTGSNAGITTDEDFGNARPLMDLTIRQVKNKLEPIINARRTPFIGGYGASSPNGITTTLGRGGSDYTATLIGAAVDADEIVIWKTVDGLMTADPDIQPDAKLIPRISYAEACEMAYFGAKAIHPKALAPVIDRQIPVRVRSCTNLSKSGTLITGDKSVKSAGIVKAITLVGKVAMINVTGASMASTPGVAARVFRVLGEAGINILMISQSSSEAGISFVAPREKLSSAMNALEVGILGTKLIENIAAEDDVCIVAAVGAGMKGTPGVAARVFKAIAGKDVNVRMIAQGSSELNISLVVGESDGANAVQALHAEFNLGNT